MMLCKSCKDVLKTMIKEEEIGLGNANEEKSLILQCFYAGRLALLLDLVGGTKTKPENVMIKNSLYLNRFGGVGKIEQEVKINE